MRRSRWCAPSCQRAAAASSPCAISETTLAAFLLDVPLEHRRRNTLLLRGDDADTVRRGLIALNSRMRQRDLSLRPGRTHAFEHCDRNRRADEES